MRQRELVKFSTFILCIRTLHGLLTLKNLHYLYIYVICASYGTYNLLYLNSAIYSHIASIRLFNVLFSYKNLALAIDSFKLP